MVYGITSIDIEGGMGPYYAHAHPFTHSENILGKCIHVFVWYLT